MIDNTKNPKHNKKKTIGYILLVLIILAVILTLTFQLGDINEIIHTFKQLDGLKFLGAIGVTFIYLIFTALTGFFIVVFQKVNISKKASFYINSTEYFFNGITPTQSGSQPIQAYYYMKEGASADDTTTVLIVNFIIYQFMVIIMSTVAIGIFYKQLLTVLDRSVWILWSGYSINILVFLFILSLVYVKGVSTFIIKLLGLLGKIKPLNKIMTRLITSTPKFVSDFQKSIKLLLKRKRITIFTTLVRIIALTGYYAIPFFVTWAFNIPVGINDLGYFLAGTIISSTLMAWFPLPGAAGGVEGTFLLTFTNLELANGTILSGNQVASIMLMWRFLSYYFAMMYGLIMYFVYHYSSYRKVKYHDIYKKAEHNPERLKIALFTDAYDPVVSGVVVSVDNLRRGLDDLGHDVYIITTKSNKAKIKDDPKIIRVPGIGLVKKSLSGFRYVPFVGRYASKIRKMNFDIIHVHTELTMGKLAVLTKKWTGAPLIYTSHTIYDDAGGYVNKRFETILYPILGKIIHNIIGKFSKTADEIVVPTIKGQEYLIKNGHKGSFNIIPTGIDLSRFHLEHINQEIVDLMKKEMEIEDDFTFIYVGRIANEKSISSLFEGFHEYLKHRPGKFIVVGGGPQLIELKELVKKWQIEKNVIFTGFVDWQMIGYYYATGNVFLNASVSETQGLTYAEAMANSRPLIVREDPGITDMIVDGENGFKYQTNEELVNKMIYVYDNQSILKEIGNKARISSNDYSKENFAIKMQHLYQETLKNILEK